MTKLKCWKKEKNLKDSWGNKSPKNQIIHVGKNMNQEFFVELRQPAGFPEMGIKQKPDKVIANSLKSKSQAIKIANKFMRKYDKC